MVEHEGKVRFTYTASSVAEKLLPNERDAEAGHNREGADILRARLPIAKEESVYPVGDLLSTVVRHTNGNMSGIVAEFIYTHATRPPNELSEEEQRVLLRGALIFDISWHSSRYARDRNAKTHGLPEHQIVRMRRERLMELDETTPILFHPQTPPEQPVQKKRKNN